MVYEALVCYYAELLMSWLRVFACIRHLREQYRTGLMPINSNKFSTELFRGNRHRLLGKRDFITFLNAFRYIQAMFKVLFKLIDAGKILSQSSN